MKLLEGVTVVDFSQFLSGPSGALTLADMGADVIKIERPETGDICRNLYVSDVIIDGDSSIFHAINRNKRSYVADLKNEEEVSKIYRLIEKADVVIHNFRPGVMERLGFSYEQLKKINPSLIYAGITGYGEETDWKHLPGQDLLLQAKSGVTWLTGNKDSDPTPMGVAIIDMLAGAHLAQGILAMLYQRGATGEGGIVQVSMFESAMDLQFEGLTTFYNDGHQLPDRSVISGAHPYVSAPYGIYKTKDSYIAIAMADVVRLGAAVESADLQKFVNPDEWYDRRDEIKIILAERLLDKTTDRWLEILEPEGFWCSRVLNYEQLRREEGYKNLEMEIIVKNSNGISVRTTRSPYRVNGEFLYSEMGAPLLGEHNAEIDRKFGLLTDKKRFSSLRNGS